MTFHKICLSDLFSNHLNLPIYHMTVPPYSMTLLTPANTLNQPQPWGGSSTSLEAATGHCPKLEYTNVNFINSFKDRLNKGSENKLTFWSLCPYSTRSSSALVPSSLQQLSAPECLPSHLHKGWPLQSSQKSPSLHCPGLSMFKNEVSQKHLCNRGHSERKSPVAQPVPSSRKSPLHDPSGQGKAK